MQFSDVMDKASSDARSEKSLYCCTSNNKCQECQECQELAQLCQEYLNEKASQRTQRTRLFQPKCKKYNFIQNFLNLLVTDVLPATCDLHRNRKERHNTQDYKNVREVQICLRVSMDVITECGRALLRSRSAPFD